MLTETKDMETILSLFGEPNAPESLIIRSGTQFLLSLYGQRYAANLCDARYRIFISRKSSTPLKILPPIDDTAKWHFLRAHLQCIAWKSADKTQPPVLNVLEYGWEMTENTPMPRYATSPIAPPGLKDVVSCQCRALANRRCSNESCSCLKAGLSCTSYCLYVGDISCVNKFTKHA